VKCCELPPLLPLLNHPAPAVKAKGRLSSRHQRRQAHAVSGTLHETKCGKRQRPPL